MYPIGPTTRAVLGLLILLPVAAGAQRLPAPLQSFQPPPPVPRQAAPAPEPPVIRPVAFGALLGAAGFVAGALIGSASTDECEAAESICVPDAVFYGAAAGGTLGMAGGVHLGNRRRGHLGLDVLGAAAVWGAGIAIAQASDNDEFTLAVLIAIPIVQLGTTVAIERATGRRRVRA